MKKKLLKILWLRNCLVLTKSCKYHTYNLFVSFVVFKKLFFFSFPYFIWRSGLDKKTRDWLIDIQEKITNPKIEYPKE